MSQKIRKPSIKKRALEFGSGLWVAMMVKALGIKKLVKRKIRIK